MGEGERIETQGGASVEGNVRAGRNFIGRDNISYENNDYLHFIRDQLIEVKVKITLMESQIDELHETGRRAAAVSWVQVANLCIAIFVIVAMVYFANSLFAVAHELRDGNAIQQHISPERVP